MPRILFFTLVAALGLSAVAQYMALSHFAFANKGGGVLAVLDTPTTPDSHVVMHDQWNPAMVILVVTSLVSSLGGLITLVITALTKAKVELNGLRNGAKIDTLHRELVRNTDATEEVKIAVDQAATIKRTEKEDRIQ